MRNRILFAMSMVGLLCCSDLREKDIAHQRVVDSLSAELQENHKLTETMIEMGILLDSIDAERGLLRVRMIEGAVYETMASRMSDLNHYVHKAEEKIAALEIASRNGNRHMKAYASVINKLRADLEVRNRELVVLKEQLSVYKNQNENIASTVYLQKVEIDDKLNQINAKQADITKLQEQISQIMVKASVDQADAYFARAVAVEEAANRTHFAPRKKKNSRREAIGLYKLALDLGKEEAQGRIAALEKEI
jgi:chromosome segregation ATPase